jgi:hypothetical protein
MKNLNVEMRCVKCDKKQKSDSKESNENWEVFQNAPCKCGGKFQIFFNENKKSSQYPKNE